ncbi:alpha/beta fold hydrolase [Nocardia sp. NBC_01327]|uniref:alpha/beta fold hydrolase n=1 Tax=Nocardia sp. NBC_01327 TaxID=2903593 RepID=UPI002E1640A0|nr:alpha/beta hydrolase [Nocardia sp. NBC_01327]
MVGERRAEYAGYRTRELYVEGAGPKLVLVHGFGHPAPCWGPVLKRCEEAGQPALAVDLPGLGAADPLTGGPQLPQLVRFLESVVRIHGAVEPVVLVGNSLGAATCVRLLDTTAGLPVGGLLALDTATDQWTPLVKAVLAGQGRPFVALAGLPGLLRGRTAARMAAKLLYGRAQAADPEIVSALLEQFDAPGRRRELASAGMRYASEVASVAGVRNIRCPTIVVHGRRDRLVTVDGSRNLAAAVPGSQLVVLEGIGHCPHLDAPDRVTELALRLAHGIAGGRTETG